MTDDIQQIILEELRAHREESRDRHEKMDVRVRNVEAWQNNANGKITIIGAVGVAIGGVATWLMDIFKH